MAKLTLDIDEKNLPIVLNILENLKNGLINNITHEKLSNNIKPISSSIEGKTNKRYISKDKYKQKLNQNIQEDEFLPKSTSRGKYLSPKDFKNRQKKDQ